MVKYFLYAVEYQLPIMFIKFATHIKQHVFQRQNTDACYCSIELEDKTLNDFDEARKNFVKFIKEFVQNLNDIQKCLLKQDF